MYNTSEKVVENLSYIESVSVSFNIPDTITITVVDATPSYVIPNGKSFLLISSKGRILEEITENTDKLPLLTCGEVKTTEVGKYVAFNDANVPDILSDVSQCLIDNKIKNITAFDVSDTANIKLVYDGKITINIGLPDDIDYKIRTAMTIINEKLDPNNTGLVAGTLDVSACSTSKFLTISLPQPSPQPQHRQQLRRLHRQRIRRVTVPAAIIHGMTALILTEIQVIMMTAKVTATATVPMAVIRVTADMTTATQTAVIQATAQMPTAMQTAAIRVSNFAAEFSV